MPGSAPHACPNAAEHTDRPTGYLAWHEWAERKSRTHRQICCSGCGLFTIWVPKKARLGEIVKLGMRGDGDERN